MEEGTSTSPPSAGHTIETMSSDLSLKVPQVLSLSELKVCLPQDVYNHLAALNDADSDVVRVEKILESMKISPADTCCRVNLLQATVDEVLNALEDHLSSMDNGDKYTVQKHGTIKDIVTIRASSSNDDDLYKCSVPPNAVPLEDFSSWTNRSKKGWPMSHRSIIVDRFCAEAVLRGAQIFVKGILCADGGIKEGEEVAVRLIYCIFSTIT